MVSGWVGKVCAEAAPVRLASANAAPSINFRINGSLGLSTWEFAGPLASAAGAVKARLAAPAQAAYELFA
jgi:hypothetical protein